jgi:hypothetical protein
MLKRTSDGGDGSDEGAESTVVRRRHRWRRLAAMVALSALLLLLIAVAALWIARRPIASNVLEREFERRGVEATYDLERVGLRTQVVRNLVIGDPQDPDLAARYAQIQLRVKWNGSVEVYRVVARGVRLEGRLADGKVSWGELDKLLPPPTDEPFKFPDVVVDVADTSISLRTPAGPVGFAVRGSGNLTGGFEGTVAVRSPLLDFGRCRVSDIAGLVDAEIVARRTHVEGPVAADRFACPQSETVIDNPRVVLDTWFGEGFDEFDGSGRISAGRIVAGPNGLASLNGKISFEGTPGDVSGEVELAARQARLGPVISRRTRLDGQYRMDAKAGATTFVGNFAAENASLAPGLIGGITNPLVGLANTPIGPVATAIAGALRRSATSFDARGDIRVVNGSTGGVAEIGSAIVETDTGATIRIAGGDGVTYYWPSGRVRIDGTIRTRGGGLPTGEVRLTRRAGGGMSGVARFQPYQVGDTRLAAQPIRFEATPGGATEFSTAVQVSGAFPEGRVRDLRLPVRGRISPNGALQIGRECITASFDFLRFRDLELGPTRLPVCPAGQQAIISQSPGGELSIGARVDDPRLSGRLAGSPARLEASSARLIGGEDFMLQDVRFQVGDPDRPVVIEADRLQGTFRGAGVTGTMNGAEAVIGNVPLLISNGDVEWGFFGGDLIIDGQVTVSDRAEEPRFYPLRSEDFHLVLSGNDIDARGTLRHPESGTVVTNVTIDHDLGTRAGGAVLDVPGITFGEGLQPEELTRLTEGVVALVEGTVRGQGRINWSGEGETKSSGEFTTVDTDLAAPFGPVEGLTTTIRFTDLLRLETAPGQIAQVNLINPGIPVEDGVVTYQLLSDQRVRIQSGVWPFMGGRLILQETVLNFGRPTAKRLTFRVEGLNAKVFVESLGLEQILATGTFDGVLPMIFDDEGGRIVGGRLEARPPGGTLAYVGEVGEMGLVAKLAFNALRELRYRDMVIRLDGDIAGDFTVRMTIDNIALGETTMASILRALTKNLRFKLNIVIQGPLRSVIQTVNSLEDPTSVISPVLPFPIDAPGIITESRRIEKETTQTQTPAGEEAEAAPEPPVESER